LRTASAPIADADRGGTDRLGDAEVDQLKRDVSRAPPGCTTRVVVRRALHDGRAWAHAAFRRPQSTDSDWQCGPFTLASRRCWRNRC